MTDAWDLRSNIKNKPGSQGTLFQPTPSVLNPQQRWPRGYTPERLNEVRKGLTRTAVTPPEHLEEEHEPGDYRDIMGYRERVARTLAKSTVPPEHLEGLKEIHGEPDDGDQGTYWPSRKKIGVDLTESGTDRTLIHEVGHHVHNDGTTSHGSYEARQEISKAAEKQAWRDKSPYTERPSRSGILQAENTVQAGVHEALADNYMVEHYRTGGRKSTSAVEGQYERNFAPDTLDRAYPGYTDVRPHQSLGPQFQQEHFQGMDLDSMLKKRLAQDDANRWAVGH